MAPVQIFTASGGETAGSDHTRESREIVKRAQEQPKVIGNSIPVNRMSHAQ